MPTFVIRESACIEKDLTRNWSSFCGGGADGPICGVDETDAIAAAATDALCFGLNKAQAEAEDEAENEM